MDAQLKRGLFEAAVLRTLKKGDSYGYMIIKDLPPELDATESTLYPILKRLETSGCVRVYYLAVRKISATRGLDYAF